MSYTTGRTSPANSLRSGLALKSMRSRDDLASHLRNEHLDLAAHNVPRHPAGLPNLDARVEATRQEHERQRILQLKMFDAQMKALQAKQEEEERALYSSPIPSPARTTPVLERKTVNPNTIAKSMPGSRRQSNDFGQFNNALGAVTSSMSNLNMFGGQRQLPFAPQRYNGSGNYVDDDELDKNNSLKYLHLNGEDDGPVQANSLPMSPTSSALDLASLPRGQPRRAPGPITASSTKNDWGSSSINLPRLDKRGNRNISDTTLGLDLRSRNSSPTPSFPNRSRPGSALQNPSNSHNGVLTSDSKSQVMNMPKGFGAASTPYQPHVTQANARNHEYINGIQSNTSSQDLESDPPDKLANANLSDLLGNLYPLCKDQQGCRFLQRQLESGEQRSRDLIFTEIFQHLPELMTDPFGNYLCQKLFESSTNDQKDRICELISPSLVVVSHNMHGTRAVQKLIDNISTSRQIRTLLQALAPSTVILIKDLNGNHVIQKCLNKLNANDNQFIYDAVASHCVEVATHRHGCCVLQRCIDHANPSQRLQLIGEITYQSLALVQDPFGNYVVQYILDLKDPSLTLAMLQQLSPHVCALSTQKFSSNVIEKCIRVADPVMRRTLIEELIDQDRLEKLLRDAFANYVVQTALDYAESSQRARLVEAIRPTLPAIRNTPYGKKLQSRLQKEQDIFNNRRLMQDNRNHGSQRTDYDQSQNLNRVFAQVQSSLVGMSSSGYSTPKIALDPQYQSQNVSRMSTPPIGYMNPFAHPQSEPSINHAVGINQYVNGYQWGGLYNPSVPANFNAYGRHA